MSTSKSAHSERLLQSHSSGQIMRSCNWSSHGLCQQKSCYPCNFNCQRDCIWIIIFFNFWTSSIKKWTPVLAKPNISGYSNVAAQKIIFSPILFHFIRFKKLFSSCFPCSHTMFQAPFCWSVVPTSHGPTFLLIYSCIYRMINVPLALRIWRQKQNITRQNNQKVIPVSSKLPQSNGKAWKAVVN